MQHIVVKFILLVPEPDSLAAEIVHRAGDPEEMLEEFGRDIFVNRILARELERDAHHVQAKHSHPAGAVALLEMAAVGQRRAPIEDADVIEPEKAALENILALGIFAVHPPGESDQQFVEDGFEKSAIAFAGLLSLRSCKRATRPSR